MIYNNRLNLDHGKNRVKMSNLGKNRRRSRLRNTESALDRQNDDYNYTESSGTRTEKSPDTNQMLNELGLGDSNTENKSNDSNDTVNDQDNYMSTGQVSEINEFESDLIDREGDVDEDSDKEKSKCNRIE
jgi:hypothetical protein